MLGTEPDVHGDHSDQLSQWTAIRNWEGAGCLLSGPRNCMAGSTETRGLGM